MTVPIARQIIFVRDFDRIDEPALNVFRIEGTTQQGATVESIAACVEHLAQWDYGDDDRVSYALRDTYADEERWAVRPSRDDTGHYCYDSTWTVLNRVDEAAPGDYVLTAHTRLGYLALDRLIEGD